MNNELKNSLRHLIESSGGVHMTAYLVNRGDPAHLKKQLSEVIQSTVQNIQNVMSRQERTKFLKPLNLMLKERNLIETLKGNVGIYRTQNSFRVLHVPIDVEQACLVATSFHIKPLLKWLQNDREFFLVGIDKDTSYLYQGNQHFIKLIATHSPKNDKTKLSKNHSSFALFRNQNSDITQALSITNWLESTLPPFSKDSNCKIYFAGKKKIINTITHELSYKNTSKDNFWTLFKTKHLNKICSEIRTINAQEIDKKFLSSFCQFEFANKLDLTEKNIFQIAKSAIQGRIEKTMIDSEVNLFGKLNRHTGELILHKRDLDHEDDCVIDDLAQTVLSRGGQVIVAPRNGVPGGHLVLAIKRSFFPEEARVNYNPESINLHRSRDFILT